jgi:type IV fimbrial biogenesis protein FimT
MHAAAIDGKRGIVMRRQMRAMGGGQRGFSLFELIVTIVIVAVLGALALPNFGSSMRSGRMTTEANELLGAINMARGEAITRAAPVSICPSADGTACTTDATTWAGGWMVFVDYGNPGEVNDADGDVVLRVWSKIDPKDSLTTATTYVRFAPTGSAEFGAGDTEQTRFLLKPEQCATDQGRAIEVGALGRANALRTCT